MAHDNCRIETTSWGKKLVAYLDKARKTHTHMVITIVRVESSSVTRQSNTRLWRTPKILSKVAQPRKKELTQAGYPANKAIIDSARNLTHPSESIMGKTRYQPE